MTTLSWGEVVGVGMVAFLAVVIGRVVLVVWIGRMIAAGMGDER